MCVSIILESIELNKNLTKNNKSYNEKFHALKARKNVLIDFWFTKDEYLFYREWETAMEYSKFFKYLKKDKEKTE